jgi:hypothetical protein
MELFPGLSQEDIIRLYLGSNNLTREEERKFTIFFNNALKTGNEEIIKIIKKRWRIPMRTVVSTYSNELLDFYLPDISRKEYQALLLAAFTPISYGNRNPPNLYAIKLLMPLVLSEGIEGERYIFRVLKYWLQTPKVQREWASRFNTDAYAELLLRAFLPGYSKFDRELNQYLLQNGYDITNLQNFFSREKDRTQNTIDDLLAEIYAPEETLAGLTINRLVNQYQPELIELRNEAIVKINQYSRAELLNIYNKFNERFNFLIDAVDVDQIPVSRDISGATEEELRDALTNLINQLNREELLEI